MTDSTCWIDLQEDDELANQVRVATGVDPARVDMGYRYLWINDLRKWATRKGLPIEYPGMGWIVEQVTVDKHQLLEFLEDMLGPEIESGPPALDAIRVLINKHGEKDCRYRIFADEY